MVLLWFDNINYSAAIEDSGLGVSSYRPAPRRDNFLSLINNLNLKRRIFLLCTNGNSLGIKSSYGDTIITEQIVMLCSKDPPEESRPLLFYHSRTMSVARHKKPLEMFEVQFRGNWFIKFLINFIIRTSLNIFLYGHCWFM